MNILSVTFTKERTEMDVAKVIQQHKRLYKLVAEKRLKESLDILSDMISGVSSGEIRDEYENIVMTYRNLLTYTIDGIIDPERDKIYTRLIQNILALSDRARQDILSRNSGWHTYWVRQQAEKELKLAGKTIIESVDDLMFKSDLDEWLKISNEIIQNPKTASMRADTDSFHNPSSDAAKIHRKLIRNIFNHFWLTDYYGDAENSLIEIILTSGNFHWYELCLFTTAITLSSLRTWQTEKLFVLIRLYSAGEEKVMERALSGLILNLHYYNGRIILYPDLIEKLKQLRSEASFREHCKIIILQIIRSRETERLGKKLHDEILPKVEKLKPMIEEKLDLENILPHKSDEKNPDWSDMFSESEEIYKTMEELTRLQMEGADVYMSAFANMKHFDFFKDFQNWFVPFYPDHETIEDIFHDEILGPGSNELAEALYKTPFICNSDKYSLLLNLKYLPSSQKKMMLKVFSMELEGLQQMNEEENEADPYRTFRINATQYLQDIYRFYKLSPYRKEFEDIFTGRLDIYNSGFFYIIFKGTDAETNLADYFFSKDFYEDALSLFMKQIPEKPSDSQIYEKIAYCYQQQADFENALHYYKMAEMIVSKVWTIKKIGLCYRHLGKNEEALDYYLKAVEQEPGNMHSVIMAGHCYLDLGRYEDALKHYFKIEYSDPGNTRILRPIAYCYFALGRFGDSEKYYDRLAETKLSGHDQINRGHLALCRGNKREAITFYRQSILSGELTREQFRKIFTSDKPLLLSLGVNADDIPIVMDYLLFITV
jgi:tetratricopeptide (TPR) repeat protein